MRWKCPLAEQHFITFNFICIVTVNTEQEQNLLTQLYFTPLVQKQQA